MAPSQFIFTTPCIGCYHRDHVKEGAELIGGALNSARCSFTSEAIECGLLLGLFNRIWFRWVQTNHAMTENSSRWCWFVMSHDRSSLKSMKVFVRRQFQSELSSHTTSSSVQDHWEWIVDLGASLHRSQTELSLMVRRSKFSLVGNEFRQALHIRFLILFGTYKDQIPRLSDLSHSNCS